MSNQTNGKRQGRCPKCDIAFRFDCPARLSDAYCPLCGEKLLKVSYKFKGEWREIVYALGPEVMRGKKVKA